MFIEKKNDPKIVYEIKIIADMVTLNNYIRKNH